MYTNKINFKLNCKTQPVGKSKMANVIDTEKESTSAPEPQTIIGLHIRGVQIDQKEINL